MVKEISKLKHVYFLGIGGIGMSALARYFVSLGISVSGYDKVRTPLCIKLEEEGMDVHYKDNPSLIPLHFFENTPETMVVYTPAIPKNMLEFEQFSQKGVALKKRAEVLGMICTNHFTIGVAGTHGKTTTTAMVAKCLQACGVQFTAFMGGVCTDFDSNYVSVPSGKMVQGKSVVLVEADEFDRSFLHLKPDIAIVTSTDADHLDIYQSAANVKNGFDDFVACIQPKGALIQAQTAELGKRQGLTHYSYGVDSGCDFVIRNSRMQEGKFVFDLQISQNQKITVTLGMPGLHNALNASAALAVVHHLGLAVDVAANALGNFKGIKRRFEILFRNEKYLVIDDYAHHPTELSAFISSVQQLYPQRKLVGVFQPHLFSRTRDFMEGFMQSLSLLDTCLLMEIYPARELPIEGVNAAKLSKGIKNCLGVFSEAEIVEYIAKNLPETFLIMGAGDIDRIPPKVKMIYEEKTV
jgi:UDP-N-acetylmuramate--alanine ligase